VDSTLDHKDEKIQYHPEANVNNHLYQVASVAIQRDYPWHVVYACMLHDVAKNTKDKRGWAQHAYRGAMLISADVDERVRWLVENHMKAIDYNSGQMRAEKRNILKDHEWFEDLMKVHECDVAGRIPDIITDWDHIIQWLNDNDPRENTAIVMVGIQASGKSTVSKAIVDASRDVGEWWKPGYERTCKDEIRLLVGAGPGGYRHQENCVQDIQHKAIRMALGRGQGIVIDNCHNTVSRRREMLEWLREEFPGLRVEAHLVYASLEVCLKRNKDEHGQPHRHRIQIPDDVLRQFHGDLIAGLGKMANDKQTEELLLKEGFDGVTITRTA
jgi:predicted kinase